MTIDHSHALRDTSPGLVRPLYTVRLAPGIEKTGPVEVMVQLPYDLWPAEAFEVQTACGISWNWSDIRRFLSLTERKGRCRMWRGAKSRGQGNSQWYGSFHTQGKTVRAHKFAAVAILGLRPQRGQHVDHACDDTLCTSCLRVLTKADNEARIRRPKKADLELARYCDMTAAEVMRVPEERRAALFRLMEVAKQIEAGCVPPGVLIDRERRKRRGRR